MSFPSHLTTTAMKNEYCKMKNPAEYFNEELETCVKTCGFGEVYDPFTGECGTLKNIRNKYKNTSSNSYIPYYLLVANCVIIFVSLLVELYKTQKIENWQMYLGIFPILYLSYKSCFPLQSNIILLLLLGINVYHLNNNWNKVVGKTV